MINVRISKRLLRACHSIIAPSGACLLSNTNACKFITEYKRPSAAVSISICSSLCSSPFDRFTRIVGLCIEFKGWRSSAFTGILHSDFHQIGQVHLTEINKIIRIDIAHGIRTTFKSELGIGCINPWRIIRKNSYTVLYFQSFSRINIDRHGRYAQISDCRLRGSYRFCHNLVIDRLGKHCLNLFQYSIEFELFISCVCIHINVFSSLNFRI
ncbi:hypothetical protein D3C76_209990 [compost metagenome]